MLAPQADRKPEGRGDEQRHRSCRGDPDEDPREHQPDECCDDEGAESNRRLGEEPRGVRDERVGEGGDADDERPERGQEERSPTCEQEPTRTECPDHRCGVCQGFVLHDVRQSAGG